MNSRDQKIIPLAAVLFGTERACKSCVRCEDIDTERLLMRRPSARSLFPPHPNVIVRCAPGRPETGSHLLIYFLRFKTLPPFVSLNRHQRTVPKGAFGGFCLLLGEVPSPFLHDQPMNVVFRPKKWPDKSRNQQSRFLA